MIKVSMNNPRRGHRVAWLAALFVLVVLGLAPSAQAACTGTLSQTFLKTWNDTGWYKLATGGSMESSTGWTLSKAKVVSGNEPWYVRSSKDSRSLSVPAGATATSPYTCIDTGSPYFRVFARNTGATSSKLKVEVLFKDSSGAVKTLPTSSISLTNSSWRLSGRLGLASGQVAQAADGTAQVAFRFSPMDSVGKWQIDDLYVDPRRR
jgi:hypothetical protein